MRHDVVPRGWTACPAKCKSKALLCHLSVAVACGLLLSLSPYSQSTLVSQVANASNLKYTLKMVSIFKKNTAHGYAKVWEYLQMAFTTVQTTVGVENVNHMTDNIFSRF